MADASVSVAAHRHGKTHWSLRSHPAEAAAISLVEDVFPQMTHRTTAANDEGWRAGLQAADLADLAVEPEPELAVQPELFDAVA